MRSRGRWLPRLSLSALAAAVLLSAAGCGLAADFAAPVTTPSCQGANCPVAAPSPLPAAVAASPTTNPGTTSSPPGHPVASSAPAANAGAWPAASPVAFTSPAAALGPVIWTSAIDPTTRAPQTPATVFTNDVQIFYATVAVDRIRAGTEISAAWTYNRTPLEGFAGSIVADTTSEHVWIEFHLALTEPGVWPSGLYEIAISVNDEPAVSGRIEVRDPER